jgi:type III secretion protein L
MVFIVRDALSRNRPDAAGKLIRAEAFWAWRDAGALIAEAQREAAAIVQCARDDHAAERRRGHAEGLLLAQREQAEAMARLAAETRLHHERVEARLIELVLAAVRQVIDDADAGVRVRSVVQRSLALVRGQKQLTLRVHPSQADALRASVGALTAPFPSLEFVDVVGDGSIAPDASLLESEIGVVAASISAQLAALETAFKSTFKATPDGSSDGAA